MSFIDIFKRPDINKGVEEFLKERNAALLDVRTEEEYDEYHIEGSINIPLQSLEKVRSKVADLSTHLYVHCLSGARSARAVRLLKQMGYSSVTDIGGISGYHGKITGGAK